MAFAYILTSELAAMVDPYVAMAMQMETKASYITGKTPKSQLKENINHFGELLDRFVPFVEQWTRGSAPKLVGLSEGVLHGFGPARKRSFQTNLKLAVNIPGESTDLLAEKCKQYRLYIAGTLFEVDDAYRGYFFHTGFIIDPQGKIILKHRKNNRPGASIELSTGPHAILDKYGNDAEKIFPVAKTPIGNLAMLIGYESRFPEVARCLALNGAELMIHPSTTGHRNPRDIETYTMLGRIRAFENNVYLMAVDWARSPSSEILNPAGTSMIVDFNGDVVSSSDMPLETCVYGLIDIERLRRVRRSRCFLAELETELYAGVYREKQCNIPNRCAEKPAQNQEENWAWGSKVIQKLIKDGIIT